MGKDRLAAFGDGVIAILITIMVLELRILHGADMAALMGVAPSFLTYVMSFVYLAIYWNNHRLFCRITRRLVGRTRTEAPGIEDEAVARGRGAMIHC